MTVRNVQRFVRIRFENLISLNKQSEIFKYQYSFAIGILLNIESFYLKVLEEGVLNIL